MSRTKWAYHCAKKWHTPNEDFPPALLQAGEHVYKIAICKECGCNYAEQVGKASQIVAPQIVIPDDINKKLS